MHQLDLFATRWRKRRSSYRPSQEPFDQKAFHVERIQEKSAKKFVLEHHYSGSFPAAIASYGLIERLGAFDTRLAGCAVFSVPMHPRSAARYGAGDLPFCELGRFVLLDEIGGNAETWFMSRALRQLALDKQDNQGRPKFSVCLAYSDPVPRSDITGAITHVGHVGGIYSAANALYVGRGTARTLNLAPDGKTISERALSKLRKGDTGARYAYEMLRGHGAPPIEVGEKNSDYVRRALSEGPFRTLKHNGNHAYIIPAGTHEQRKAVRSIIGGRQRHPVASDKAHHLCG